MPRLLRVAVVIAAVCIALAAAGLVAAAVFLRSQTGREFTHLAIERALRSSVNGVVTFDDIRVSMPLAARVSGLVFRTSDGTPVIRVQSVSARVSFVPLLFGRLTLTDCRVSGGYVLYEPRSSQGLSRLFHVAGSLGGARTPRISRIVLDSTAFICRDTAAGYAVELSPIAGVGTLSAFARLDARLTCPGGTARFAGRSVPIDTVSVAGSVDAGACTIRQARVVADRASIEGRGTIPYRAADDWQATLSCEADSATLHALAGAPRGWRPGTSLRVSASLQGPLDRQSIRVSVRGTGWSLGGVVLDTARLDAERQPDGTSAARVSLRGRTVAGSAEVRASLPAWGHLPAGLRYRATGRLAAPSLPDLVRQAATGVELPGDLAARASVTFDVAGSDAGAPDSVHATAIIDGISVHGETIAGQLLVNGRMLGTVFSVEGRQGSGLTFAGGGSTSGKGFSGDLDFSIHDLRQYLGIVTEEEFGGAISGRLHANNALGSLYAIARLSGAGITWRGLVADTVAVEIQHADEETEILSCNATVGGSPDSSMAALLHLPSVRGGFSASVSLQGAVDNPHVWATVRVDSPSVSGVSFDSLHCRAELDDGDIRVEDFRARRREECLVGSAAWHIPTQTGKARVSLLRYDATGTIDAGSCAVDVALHAGVIDSADVRAQGVEISSLGAWWPALAPVRGRLTLDAHASGPLPRPAMSAALSVTGLSVGASASEIELRAQGESDLRDARAACTLYAAGVSAPVQVAVVARWMEASSWQVDTTAAGCPRIRCIADAVTVQSFASLMPPGWSAEGRISADLSAAFRGGRLTPDGSLTIEDGRLAISSPPFSAENISARLTPDAVPGAPDLRGILRVAAGPVRIGGYRFARLRSKGIVDTRQIAVDTLVLERDEGRLLVAGRLPLGGVPGSADRPHAVVSIDRFPVAALNGIAEGIEATRGTLSGELRIDEDHGRARLDGTVRGDSVVVLLGGLAPAAGPITLVVRFHGDSASVHSTAGRWGKGRLDLRGAFRIVPVDSIAGRFNVTGTGLPLTWDGDQTLFVDSGRIALRYGPDASAIEGDILLGRSSVYYDVNLFEQVLGGAAAAPATDSAVPFDPHLNLTVRAPGTLAANVTFGNRFAGAASTFDALLDGTLNLQGTWMHPRYAGQIRVTRGTVSYLGTLFSVTDGSARQPLGNELNPFVNVAATASLRTGRDSLHIVLRLSGELNRLLLNLSSSPRQYSEPEIASLLTLGMTPGSPSPGGGLVRDRATALLSQSVSAYASQKARQMFGLDQMQITGDFFDTRQAAETQLTVSKRLRPNLELTYQGRVGNPRDQKAILSWRMLPFLYLDGESDVQGNAGLDLKLKVER